MFKTGFWNLAALCLLIVAAALATPSIAMQGDTVADRVLGQPNFSTTSPSSISSRGLNGPTAVAIDKSVVPNRLYVSDSMNNRILGYKDVTSLINGGPADLVIGQSSFSSNGCTNGGLSASSLCQPHGIAVDAGGNLYVADTNTNRVLEYNTPFAGCGSFPCIGAPANRVFGQGGFFNSGLCNDAGISASSLCGPVGVALDTNGNLYVADTSNNRVLEYNTPLTTDTTADKVFGQGGSFTASTGNNGGISANSLFGPNGVVVNAGGDLYIVDTNNSRVLEYNTPLTNTTANAVFGQLGSFTTTSNACGGPSTRNLCLPQGVTVDAGGNLYIADHNFNRVLEYGSPSTNTIADVVFGQLGSFSTANRNDGGLSADSLYNPTMLALDTSGNLYVADYANNRVLEYTTPLTTDTTADVVLGQNDFSNNAPNWRVTTATSLPYPSSVAIDTSVVPNRLYVADTMSNRVLGWKDVTAISVNSPADLVIGQSNFTSYSCNKGNVIPSAGSLCGVSEVAVDGSGNLYVGDNSNHRVLEYNNPFAGCGSFPCVGGSANLVFGQGGSFTSNFANNGGVSANSLAIPSALAVDADGNLYVSDTNNRVLEYNTPLTTDTTADLVFGQGGSFTSNACNKGGLSASSLCGPDGVAVDASGDVFIADTSNCRVLEYDSPLTTDTIADQAFGQPDFVSNTCNKGGTNANSLFFPFGLGLDPYGDLYVSDNNNNRVLEYNNPHSNNTANLAFGQFASFTTRTCNNAGVSASSLCGPLDVKADVNGNIYVADAINGRVLEYDNPLGLTATPSPTATATATATPTATATATATPTATDTPTSTPSDTVTATATSTATATATDTPAATASDTATATATGTATATATATATDTATATASATATDTPTATATATSTATATDTSTATATATTTATPTATATATASATATNTATATPTATPTTSMSVTASLAFGNVAVGQTVTKNATVYNTGATHPLVISSATPSDAEYALSGTGTCGAIPITVAPKTSCTLGVTFTPNAVGTHNATLTLTDNAATSPQHVTLSGTGIAGLTLSKSSLVYGSVKFGSKGIASFSVTNRQTQQVTLSESFSGTNAADFTVSGGTCTAMLAAKTSCSIIVSFSPGVLGTESATLTVSDSPDPLSPYHVALSTGATIPDTVAPTTLAYGTVSRTSMKTLKTTVTNKSPFTLSIGSAISGANASDFTITGGTCGPTLGGNSSCTVAVTFKPTTTTAESATLAVSVSSDPTSPHNVTLTGTGS